MTGVLNKDRMNTNRNPKGWGSGTRRDKNTIAAADWPPVINRERQ